MLRYALLSLSWSHTLCTACHFEPTPSISLQLEAVSYFFIQFKKHNNTIHLFAMYSMKMRWKFHICNACNVCEHLQITSIILRGAGTNCKVEWYKIKICVRGWYSLKSNTSFFLQNFYCQFQWIKCCFSCVGTEHMYLIDIAIYSCTVQLLTDTTELKNLWVY